MLNISLLGSPHITLNGRTLHFGSVKAIALLAYLTTSGMLHDRAELAALLWPESDNKRARGALRYTLNLLKKELDDEFLLINRRQVGLNMQANWEADIVTIRTIFTTVIKVKQTVNSDEVALLEKAVALYRADFLQGFTLADSGQFNDWASTQQEELRRKLGMALKQLVIYYQERQHWDTAITYAHRWLNLNPFHELAHCHLMQLYAAAGEWTAVHNQYQSLVDLLQHELGTPPQPSTTSLYNRLRERHEQRPLLNELTPDQKSRYVLIEKVKRFWVQGFLQPLHDDQRYITLRLKTANQLITHPWDDVLSTTQQTAVATIHDAFYQANQALLILGAPGAGKTTTLIELASRLLKQAQEDAYHIVPVILNLSSWVAEQQSIAAWAVEEMVAKYQIPRRIGRRWLKEDRLLLFLDGLDEMESENQLTCIMAINNYRQSHGLADLVVCCRDEAYEAAVQSSANNQLQLHGAVHIQPLTTAQIHQQLPPEIADTIFQNETLLEMAQSPLNLNMLQVVLAQNGVHFDKHQNLKHSILFDQYVDYMYQRQAGKNQPAVLEPKLTGHLSWLANQMQTHHQAIFLIEQIQPSWLVHSSWSWLYLLLAHASLPALFGIPILWSFIQLIRINPPYIEINFFSEMANLWGWQHTSLNYLFILFSLNFLGSFLSSMITGLFFVWHQNRYPSSIDSLWRWWLQSGVAALVAWAAVTLPLMQTDEPPLALFLGGLVAIGFIITSSNLEHKKSFQSDIRIRGLLKWSWKNAAQFGLIGALLSVIWSGIIWLRDPTATAIGLNAFNMGFLFFLIGGLTDKIIQVNTRPNEGMYIAGLNGLKAMIITAVPSFVLTALTVNWLSGIYTGIMIGVFAGTVHGLNDVAKHLILRILLWCKQGVPLNYVGLLDFAADCVLLQKVGGGYTFRHRLLQEYFANKRQ